MAFSSAFRRFLNGSSSVMKSQLISVRFCTTVTTPKLIITGLNSYTTDEKLRKAFAPFGRLVEAKIIKIIWDEGTGRSKMVAVVIYATIYEAERARQAMNGKLLDGWSIVVTPEKPTELRCPSYSELHEPLEFRLRSLSEIQQQSREVTHPSKSEFQHQPMIVRRFS